MGQGSHGRVVLIGRGNVATHIGKALEDAGYQLLRAGGKHRDAPLPKDADLYVIAVTDSAIRQVAEEIGDVDGLVVHTAGSVPLDILPQKRRGVIYPMQTFSRDRELDFRRIPLFVESDTDMDYVRRVASSISETVYSMDSRRRSVLHLAAVFCCNFTNRMYGLACDLLDAEGIPFSVMLPLIDETAAKVHDLAPSKAQTGPALRWDEGVMRKHLMMLADSNARDIYELVSKDIHNDKLRLEEDKGNCP